MALTKDLIGIGMPEEEANRVGVNGPQYITTSTGSAASTATIIGGPNGANLITVNASANAALTFSPSTELADVFTIANVGTTLVIFTPYSTSSAWQTGSTSATNSLSMASGKSAMIWRVGPEPAPAGSVLSDRWIYVLTA